MKRREFLKNKGILLTSAMISPQIIIPKVGANDTINVGIIGTGARGAGIMPIFDKMPGFKVVAACDTLDFRLENGLSKASDKCKGYQDYKKLLENKDVDAVVIATPLNTHFEIAKDAIEVGKHVYCEKTMTYRTGEALELLSLVENSNQLFQVGHQYRSTPLYFYVADMIRKGYIGDVTNVQVQWNRNGNWRKKIPSPELERQINWRMYTEYSGGLTAELHSHQIDFVNYVFNQYPNKVIGIGGIDYWKDGRETFDNVNTVFDYHGFTLNCVALTANAFDGYLMRFKGKEGTIEMNMTEAWIYSENRDKTELQNIDGVTGATALALSNGNRVSIHPEDDGKAWSNSKYAIHAFYQSILNNKEPYSNIHNGGGTAICVQMAIDALREESVQYWKPEYNRFKI